MKQKLMSVLQILTVLTVNIALTHVVVTDPSFEGVFCLGERKFLKVDPKSSVYLSTSFFFLDGVNEHGDSL